MKRGRPGTKTMRALLDERLIGYRPPDSGLEARLIAVLVDAGLPAPERQVELGGTEWIGRVDLYYRAERLVVEVDSDRHHTPKLDVVADERRDRALREGGFEVVRVLESDIDHCAAVAVQKVEHALRARRAA